MNLPEKLTRKLRDLPDKPGCYLMRDARGRIVYIGKAISLRKRVKSYFRDGTMRSATPKLRGLVKSVHDVDIIVLKNEEEALLTEGRLIKEYRPRYNVSFKDDKRFLMIRLELQEPMPRFKVCRIQRDDHALYFGPYASSSAARVALDFVEKRFGIRKCTPRRPGEEEFKHCINDVVRFCSAPCIGRVSEEEYRVSLSEAVAFLQGERPEILKEMRADMETAADRLQFEKAAAIRDTLLKLQTAVKQRVRIAATPKMKRENAQAGVGELQASLGMDRSPRVIECFDISNISGTLAVASMVVAVDGMPTPNRYRRFRIKTVEGSDDPAMMAEAVSRRYKRVLDEGGDLPDLLLVDGGITQLRAARAELIRLGIDSLASAGLAKREELVYWIDGEEPLALGRDSHGLKVLQRIRDEAHRFALTYHRKLRNDKIRESVLDEVPGVGTRRKEDLLTHFGSMRRLMKATEAQIACAPGIGPEMARTLYLYLNELT